MSRMKEQEAAARQRVADIDAEIARLMGQRDGIIETLALYGADTSAFSANVSKVTEPPRTRTRGVKEAVLEIVTKAGDAGLTVNDVLERAEANGVHLDRGSVSSLLSRLKREDTLQMEGGRYSPKKAKPSWGATVN